MGHNIIIATGRHPSIIIKKLSDHIKKISYIIGGNGSLIFDVKANKMIFSNSIPQNYVPEIIEYVRNLESLLLYMNKNGT
jgi:hydroxymethylpyrimidine pyrophosphatase-like HAD family hydrolase